MLNGSANAKSLRRPSIEEGPVADQSGTEHILIPTDLAGHERTAVLLGLKMAAACQAKITLLRVLPREDPPNSMHWLDGIDGLHRALRDASRVAQTRDIVATVEAQRAEILRYFDGEVPPHLRPDIRVDAECRFGDYATEVSRFAEDTDVDLVILCGARKLWGLSHWASRERRVLQLTSKQVIVLRPDAGSVRSNGHAHIPNGLQSRD